MNNKEIASVFEPSRFFPALLNTLNNRLSSGASDLYLKHFGVGINEWRILTVLARSPKCTAKFISDQGAIHITVISRSLRAMAEKGLVKIDRVAWQRSLSLTAAGKVVHDRVAEVALEIERLLMQGLAENEKAMLLVFLARMNANIAQVDAYEPAP